jgi:hypothetical protein
MSTPPHTSTPIPSAADRARAAKRFAVLGCRIAPAAGKNPGGYLGDRWQHKAIRDPGLIDALWEAYPRANVAIVPDRALLPLDVDDPASFERFQAKYGEAPRTPRYLTGGDGGRERLLFAFPGDEALKHATRKLCDGVQWRWSHNTNLVCIVPPGVNPSTGRLIRWTTDLDEAPLADTPAPWLGCVQERKPAKGSSYWAQILTREYATGCGDTHPDVLSLAGWLMRRLQCGDAVLELLLCWNEHHCHPPKPRSEIASIVDWVKKREDARAYSGALVLGDAGLRSERYAAVFAPIET